MKKKKILIIKEPKTDTKIDSKKYLKYCAKNF
jgi:hypothetical protein